MKMDLINKKIVVKNILEANERIAEENPDEAERPAQIGVRVGERHAPLGLLPGGLQDRFRVLHPAVPSSVQVGPHEKLIDQGEIGIDLEHPVAVAAGLL